MYQIRCDDYVLYDPRDDELILLNPKCKLEVNKVGGGSFTILPDHPYYGRLKKLKSIFEIRQNNQVIFRGRMTNDSRDFYNRLDVDLEGVLAFTNDTLIPPFNFPDDFPEAESAENVVKYFLSWIIDQHNSQATPWQQLKLGTVSVSDPNNYITRSSSKYDSAWNTLKSKLFDSALGGYLCIRYEADGNYVDYMDSFEMTNTQQITFAENLLDMTSESDATKTYSAILPLGAQLEDEDGEKHTLSLAALPDVELTDDLVKKGRFVYSKSAVDTYGWKCVPVEDSTWEDITEATNLQNKAVEQLSGDAVKLSGTITLKAVDLYFTDDQIQSFRINRNIIVNTPVHGVTNVSYFLTSLDIDIQKPQNTIIVVGTTFRSLTDINEQNQSSTIERVESAEKDIEENRSEVTNVKNQLITQSTEIINTCKEIILSALESYVETSNYEEFRQTVESQLLLMADQMTVRFTETTQRIEDVNGDLQEKFNTITKFFTFDIDGFTIGQIDSKYKVIIDNDRYSMLANNVEVLWFDGEGKAHIPELTITQGVNLFGYLINQDNNGNVNCEYIGGE